jgi:pimeloyl-ACP methyl ester carboxylesterase
MRWASNGSTATGYSMGGLIAQLLWRRHPELTSQLVLGASSRNFLGTPAERMASLFAPAFTVAVRMNPLWSALGAGMLGPSLVNDLGGEVRQFALAEMNRTSMTTVAAALVAVSEFTSHDWIGQIDVPRPGPVQREAAGSVPGHPDGVIRLSRSAIRRQLPDEPRTAPDGG